MSMLRQMGRLSVVAAAALSAAVITVGGDVRTDTPVAAADCGLDAGGEYHTLAPFRLFDSRPETAVNDPAPGRKPIDPARPFTVAVAGQKGLPAVADILAVVANVTVVEPDAGGWLAVRPTGGQGGSALVNFTAGRNVPNLGIVAVGPDGSITVTMGPGQNASAHVVIDVFGFISKSCFARGARLETVGPARLIDTREPGMGGPFVTGEVRPIRIRGASTYSPALTIPAGGDVTAALVNIVAVNNRPGNTSTFLSATPTPPALPIQTANLNVVSGQIKSNLAIVPIGPDGNIYLYNHSGLADVVIDVFGYFHSGADVGTTQGRVVPLSSPFRAIDTREPAFGNVPLGSGSVEDWSFNAFAKSVSLPGSGEMAQGSLIGNLTATDLRRAYSYVPASTFLTAYPGDVGRPLTANLNLAEGEVVGNMSVMPYGTTGTDPYVLKVYNHYGSTHYVLDVYAIVLD